MSPSLAHAPPRAGAEPAGSARVRGAPALNVGAPLAHAVATRVSAADDPLEREADQVADRALSGAVWPPIVTAAPRVLAPTRAPAARRPGAAAGFAFQLATRVGRADDPLDHAADGATARATAADAGLQPTASASTPAVQRMCATCARAASEGRETPCPDCGAQIQRRERPGAGDASEPSGLGATLAGLHGRGVPLDAGLRGHFEGRMGADFGAVRVHTGPSAADAAHSLDALAFAHHNHIVFAPGQYAPDGPAGRRLIAHELAHVVQQGAAPARGAGAGSGAGVRRRAAHPTVQRQVAPTSSDPTLSTMTDESARAMSDDALSTAIAKAESFVASTPVPDLRWGQVAANLENLKRERARRARPAQPSSAANSTPAEAGAKSSWQEGQEVGALGIVQTDAGTVLRRQPDPSAVGITTLALNTRLAVDRKVAGGWYFVILDNGDFGYVPQAEINTSLPDPEARLYRIEEGMSAQKIVKRFYKDFVWGKDERFYVNVLVFVNAEAGRRGITKPSLDADWDTTVTKTGLQIWIPGEGYANSLRSKVSTGSFTYETWRKVRDFVVAAAEFIEGIVAFVAGILHGALESLWDLLVGLVDLIEMLGKLLLSIIKGELLSDARGLWEAIAKLKLSDIFDTVTDWLDKRWNADGIWSRWRFRGWLIGYIIMELVMLFFSDGVITAVKWVGKSAKVANLLEKIPMLARVVKRAEELKDIKVVERLKSAVKGSEGLSSALKWAESVLRIPAEILKDLTLEAIERLKKLPDWAIERFRELSSAAMKFVLGCASPCKVDLQAILKYLADPAAKAIKSARRLLAVDEVLAALPKDLNLTKIRVYLQEYPALMEAIKSAELTDADFGKLVDFITRADKANPETAYKTFVRYLSFVVPSKSGGDISKFNKIAEAMVKADTAQGAALKGSMFEVFMRVHVPEFAGKAFRRVRFKASGTLELATEARTSDFFIEASGELWDFKHSMKVDLKQAKDYLKILNHAEAGLPKVVSINYVFPTKAWAEANRFLYDNYRFAVRYLDEASGALVVLK